MIICDNTELTVCSLEILFEETLVIFCADDVGPVTIELHANGVPGHAHRKVAKIVVGNTSQGRQPRYGVRNLLRRDGLPVFVIGAENLPEMMRKAAKKGGIGNCPIYAF
jgi:hypothetical protein